MPNLYTAPVLSHQPALPVARPRQWAVPRVVRRAAAIITAISLLSVVAQVLYPASRSLPRASFAGYDLGFMTEAEVASKLSGLNSKQFKAKAVKSSYDVSMGDIGLGWDGERIAKQLTEYPLSKRLVPFSAMFYQAEVTDNKLSVADREALDVFAAKVAAENNRAAVEGSIAYEKDSYKITSSTPGVRYVPEDMIAYFAAASDEVVAAEATLPYTAVPPVNTREHLETLVAQAETLAARGLSVSVEGISEQIPGAGLKQAIAFGPDAQGKLQLQLDERLLGVALENLVDKAFISPSGGAAGRELDRTATAAAVKQALGQGERTAVGSLRSLPAGAKLYPATSKGIKQLIDDWKAAHSSLGMAADFAEIGGLQRAASLDPEARYFSASVYKVFPAWYALDQIDQGKLDANGVIAAGMKLEACFNNMIIVSSSECSESIVAKYGGWGVMDSFAQEHGISGITLSSGVSITARGMTQFLQKLDGGVLLSPERTNYLLDVMKRQKYRQAIPAGSAGPVADKVGYNPRTYSWHDAGIVYHPKGKYTLVVLTRQGASLTTLSDLARKISDTLAR